jgi:predicted RNase H-like HicB family nuclease
VVRFHSLAPFYFQDVTTEIPQIQCRLLNNRPLQSMNANHHYSARIHWSEEDRLYIACTDELPGCIADGKTSQEALSNLGTVIEEWLDVANEEGRSIPEPLTMETFDRILRQSREDLEGAMADRVSSAQGCPANSEGSTAAPAAIWPATLASCEAKRAA